MKTAGWIFIVIGVLAFLGAASKGHSVFGPLFWIGIGSVLIYLKREGSNKCGKDHCETYRDETTRENSGKRGKG